MNTRILAASVLSLGLLSSVSFAAEGVRFGNCPNGGTYDRDYNVCLDSRGVEITDTAGFNVPGGSAAQVDKRSVGDFIDETKEQRNQRSSK